MTLEELIAAAAPACGECGGPVQRVETRWELTDGGEWVPGVYWMVCADGHRAAVEML